MSQMLFLIDLPINLFSSFLLNFGFLFPGKSLSGRKGFNATTADLSCNTWVWTYTIAVLQKWCKAVYDASFSNVLVTQSFEYV